MLRGKIKSVLCVERTKEKKRDSAEGGIFRITVHCLFLLLCVAQTSLHHLVCCEGDTFQIVPSRLCVFDLPLERIELAMERTSTCSTYSSEVSSLGYNPSLSRDVDGVGVTCYGRERESEKESVRER